MRLRHPVYGPSVTAPVFVEATQQKKTFTLRPAFSTLLAIHKLTLRHETSHIAASRGGFLHDRTSILRHAVYCLRTQSKHVSSRAHVHTKYDFHTVATPPTKPKSARRAKTERKIDMYRCGALFSKRILRNWCNELIVNTCQYYTTHIFQYEVFQKQLICFAT